MFSNKYMSLSILFAVMKLIWHKSTLAVPKYFPKILGTFKIINLGTSNCVKDWGKVAPAELR